ncbi:unnamed protein product, partial [Brassica rapa subsp. trilocularis]
AVNSVKIFIVSFTCQDDVRESKGIQKIYSYLHLNNMSIFFYFFFFYTIFPQLCLFFCMLNLKLNLW